MERALVRAGSMRRRYIALAVIGIPSILYESLITRDLLSTDFQRQAPLRLPVSFGDNSRVVTAASEAALRAGLRTGDEVLAINDQQFRGYSLIQRIEGPVARMRVHRGGREIVVDVPMAPSQQAFSGVQVRLVTTVLLGVMPWLCIALGLWAAAVRPWDSQAWLLLLLMLSFPHLGGANLGHWNGALRKFGLLHHYALASLLPVGMVLFGVYFAERLPLDRRFPWLKYLLIAPVLAGGAARTLLAYLREEDLLAAPALLAILPRFTILFGIGQFASIAVFFTCLGLKMGLTRNPDARRRLRLLMVGTQIAMGPMFLLIVYALATNQGDFRFAPAWLAIACMLMISLFPLTITYVIVVHRALDLRVVLRQGIQYALARGGAIVVFLLLGAAIMIAAMNLALDPAVSRPSKFAVITGSVAVLFVLQRVRLTIAGWIDRKFFRQAYDAERVLTDLTEQVRTIVDSDALLRTVGGRISETLLVPRVIFFLAHGEVYRPAYSVGYQSAPELAFSKDAATVAQISQANEPARVYLDDKNSWVYRTPNMTTEEKKKLEEIESQLILPLAVKQKLLGFISLGQKRSEEPYTGSDLRLLRTLAAQTGLALENSRLAAEIALEAAQREKLNRELEIAREVQERLFPQKTPVVDGLDCAGGCRPALGVGGDYYDFLDQADGKLGVVIGDVAGKGIGAALLMASLQASVRGQALRPGETLAEIVTRVNTLIFESSASSRYATLFYGLLDPKNLDLVYVNAGHNPPLVVRASGDVEPLAAGGTVVGLLPRFPYQQGSTQLRRGDILVCFTDGISEAQNAAHEEWGEDRLVTAVRAAGPAPSSELIRIILDEADRFVAGAPQHDDMTMVIVRVL